MTVGKAVGGGLPLGAYGMSAELGRRLRARPSLAGATGELATGGTLFGNALSMAAARAVLTEVLTPEAYEHAAALGARLADGLEAVVARAGLPWKVQRLYAALRASASAAASPATPPRPTPTSSRSSTRCCGSTSPTAACGRPSAPPARRCRWPPPATTSTCTWPPSTLSCGTWRHRRAISLGTSWSSFERTESTGAAGLARAGAATGMEAAMRAFVTGGAGFLGSALVRQLVARGDVVVALARSDASARRLEELVAGAGAHRVERGEVTDPAALREGMAGADAVFHVAGDYRIGIPAGDRPGMYASNVEGTRAVLDAAAAAGVGRVVYVSTANVFGNTRGRVVDETYRRTDRRFLSYYDETKFLAHELVGQRVAAGQPVVIVCSGGIYGPGDHSELGRQIAQAAAGGYRIRMFPGLGISLAYVDDTAAGLMLAHDAGRPGETYILGGENVTLGRVLDLTARATGHTAPRLTLPPWALRALHTARPLARAAVRRRPRSRRGDPCLGRRDLLGRRARRRGASSATGRATLSAACPSFWAAPSRTAAPETAVDRLGPEAARGGVPSSIVDVRHVRVAIAGGRSPAARPRRCGAGRRRSAGSAPPPRSPPGRRGASSRGSARCPRPAAAATPGRAAPASRPSPRAMRSTRSTSCRLCWKFSPWKRG